MEDELLAEYDFTQMKGGVRGKYVERYRAGTNLVLLDPDIVQAFPNDASVNEALRMLIEMVASLFCIYSAVPARVCYQSRAGTAL
ncbi:hypothetical protein [Microcoleus sp. PH2017_35_SFW_U_B]|nr:hypothetical protein [Microcoleus sp. PH2017_35_SFW_U_B]